MPRSLNKHGERPAKTAAGTETSDEILRAAADILINQGYAALSLRKIADKCDITIGNLTYHFSTKRELVKALLETILDSLINRSDHIYADDSLSPKEKLRWILTVWIDDLQTKRSTYLFPELWAMANHDEFLSERLNEFYARGQRRFGALIAAINPALPDAERAAVAAYISSTIEGMTIFVGYGKPWAGRISWMAGIAITGLLRLVETISAEEVRHLAGDWSLLKKTAGLPEHQQIEDILLKLSSDTKVGERPFE